jgi:hypothetical protein
MKITNTTLNAQLPRMGAMEFDSELGSTGERARVNALHGNPSQYGIIPSSVISCFAHVMLSI